MEADLEIQGCSPGCEWFSCPACCPLNHLIRCPRAECSALHALDALAHGWVVCECGMRLRLAPKRSAEKLARANGATVYPAMVATYTDALAQIARPIDWDELAHLAVTRTARKVPQALLARPGEGLLRRIAVRPRTLH